MMVPCPQRFRTVDDSTGFTLIEVLIAMTILVIITGTVFASFSSIVNSVESTRVTAEEMRLRQFLQRSFNANFTTTYINGDNDTYDSTFFQFVGVNGTDSHGHADSVRFLSSSPIVGGGALPGDLKEVKYEIQSTDEDGNKLFADDKDATQPEDEQQSLKDHMLQCTETPIAQGNIQSLDTGSAGGAAVQADASYVAPMWTVPIQSFDVLYFDGTAWLEEWDSEQVGRMPWAVHIRIGFAKPESMREADKEEGFNINDDPDIELVISIPSGLGVTLDQRDFQTSTGTADPNDTNDTNRANDTNDANDTDRTNDGNYTNDSGQSNSGKPGNSSS